MGTQREQQGRVTLEDLAIMVQQGFGEINQKMDQRFDTIEGRIIHLERGQEEIQLRLSQAAYRHELSVLEARMDHVERFVKIRK